MLHAACYTPRATRRVLHAACYTPHATRRMLHAACYTPCTRRPQYPSSCNNVPLISKGSSQAPKAPNPPTLHYPPPTGRINAPRQPPAAKTYNFCHQKMTSREKKKHIAIAWTVTALLVTFAGDTSPPRGKGAQERLQLLLPLCLKNYLLEVCIFSAIPTKIFC